MNKKHINTADLERIAPTLKVGETIYLSGTVYTARDAAHQRLIDLIKENKPLPFTIKGATIYYAGPTETPPGLAIGSCGPTTSGRMDSFSPTLMEIGLTAMIGKGERSPEVVDSIVKNKAVYLLAIGGGGALAAKCITSCEVIAFSELGCESIKRLELKNFPLIVGIDSNGSNIFKR